MGETVGADVEMDLLLRGVEHRRQTVGGGGGRTRDGRGGVVGGGSEGIRDSRGVGDSSGGGALPNFAFPPPLIMFSPFFCTY